MPPIPSIPAGRADDNAARHRYRLGVLSARPNLQASSKPVPKPGTHALGLHAEGGRDALLYLPRSATPGPLPMLVLLHGAGGAAEPVLAAFRLLAEEWGVLLIAPPSRGVTWDLIEGRLGPDVRFLDQVLEHVFAHYAIAPEKVALAGFSDGASYALTIGLANGGLFRAVLAFSPGFAAPAKTSETTRIFVSHGVHDQVLPIDACSRRIMPMLRSQSRQVQYVEFDGGHGMPGPILQRAFTWYLGPATQ